MVECPTLNGPKLPILPYVPLFLRKVKLQTPAEFRNTKGQCNLSAKWLQVQLAQLPGANELPLQLCNVTALAVQAAEQFDTLLFFIQQALNGDPPRPPQVFKRLNLICVTNMGYPIVEFNVAQAWSPNPYPRHLTYPHPLRTLCRQPESRQPAVKRLQLWPLNNEQGGAKFIESRNLEFP